jgi:hypothetical protein
MPRRKLGSGHLCRRVEEWPEADQAAWRKAVQEADPFAANTPAASWSERSRLKTARGYGRFLAWRSEKGLDPEQAPGDRVTAPVVKTYIADLARINGDFTVLCRVQELCDAIRVIAPDRDWGWLRQIQNTLRARSVSVRDKRARMQPAGELVKLGKALMRKAETATTRPSLTRAVWFRDGLMIALLAYRPLRLSNLAAITLGRHLIHQSRGYRLYFSADEVKGGLDFGDRCRLGSQLAHSSRIRKALVGPSFPRLRCDNHRYRRPETRPQHHEYPRAFDAGDLREALQSGAKLGGEPPVSEGYRRPAPLLRGEWLLKDLFDHAAILGRPKLSGRLFSAVAAARSHRGDYTKVL